MGETHVKTVFLDRDGVICRDVNYCSRVEDFVMLPGVSQAIKLLNVNGYKAIVITNQSGIARGYFTHQVLTDIHKKMTDELTSDGVKLDGIFYCPHHPGDGCDCRKPKTALFEQAIEEFGIDTSLSFMVGDAQSDIDAGKAIGCRTILVSHEYEENESVIGADYTVGSLLKAVGLILEL